MIIGTKKVRITPEKLVDMAEMAIASEIEAVRERPSNDVLTSGKRVGSPGGDEVHYRFETTNPSLRFAEQCKASMPGEDVTIHPVETGEEAITFRFPGNYGESIAEVELEWENDFVLRRIQESLMSLLDSTDCRERIKRMIYPHKAEVDAAAASADEVDEKLATGRSTSRDADLKTGHKTDRKIGRKTGHKTDSDRHAIREDGMRNEAQFDAIRKAMVQPVSYIWGPPGTGKTATLAYIMANYLLRGRSVLFVSNTNRAVDNGMLGLMDAMEALGLRAITRRITRFGERILENERLDSIHFEHQLAEMMKSQMQEAADLQHWLDALSLPDLTSQQKKHIEDKIERMGGSEAVEEQIHEITQKERHAYVQLRRFKVIGTTLARVCTSEMLEPMDFDAVVVDEASMANIPYMLVVASKAKEHLVVVGDPMQLPPIAITGDTESRSVLEQDLFAAVSGAKSTEELFQWHDDHPGFTSFFNIQYRMQSDLAKVISEVFYEGRLLSAADMVADDGNGPATTGTTMTGTTMTDSSTTSSKRIRSSITLLDSSPMRPSLRQDNRRRGFQPINDIHVTLLSDLVRQLLTKDRVALHEIGIIVPFRSTVWHLRRELRGNNRWYDLEIGTIHTFQGREKRVIILDTVMSGEARSGSVHHYSVRPFDEAKNGLSVPRLLNVAFSRSRERLVVLADMEHVRRVYGRKFLGKLLNRLPLE